jgi:hypothetical protein
MDSIPKRHAEKTEPSACLFELQLNNKRLELVEFEKQLELVKCKNDVWNVLYERLVDMQLVSKVLYTPYAEMMFKYLLDIILLITRSKAQIMCLATFLG